MGGGRMGASFWDERFAGEEYRYGTEPNDFLREQAAVIPAGGRVLSLGEGEGRNAVHLASLGYRVTAVDGSAVGLAKLGRLAESRGVRVDTVLADLGDYALGRSQWDGIVNFYCHLPAALRRKVNAQIAGALRPGGVLILEGFTPAQLQFDTGGPRDPDMLWSAAQLADELAGLDFPILREVQRPVIEGAGHSGMAAVVQVLARKP